MLPPRGNVSPVNEGDQMGDLGSPFGGELVCV